MDQKTCDLAFRCSQALAGWPLSFPQGPRCDGTERRLSLLLQLCRRQGRFPGSHLLQIWLFKEIKKHQNLLRNFHNIQGTRAPEEKPHMYKDMEPPQRKLRAWNQIQNLYYRVTVPTTAPLFYFKGPILLVSSTCNPARFSVQPGKHLLSPGISFICKT